MAYMDDKVHCTNCKKDCAFNYLRPCDSLTTVCPICGLIVACVPAWQVETSYFNKDLIGKNFNTWDWIEDSAEDEKDQGILEKGSIY